MAKIGKEEIAALYFVDAGKETNLHTLSRFAFELERLWVATKVTGIINETQKAQIDEAVSYASWLGIKKEIIEQASSTIPLETQIDYLNSFWTLEERREIVLERVALALVRVDIAIRDEADDKTIEELWHDSFNAMMHIENTLGISLDEQEAAWKTLFEKLKRST